MVNQFIKALFSNVATADIPGAFMQAEMEIQYQATNQEIQCKRHRLEIPCHEGLEGVQRGFAQIIGPSATYMN